jgi:prepilin-type N-terminal cleavage/methylation domain-containing protein
MESLKNKREENKMKKLSNLRNKKKGFTLIELIVVIAILGILAAIGTPLILGQVANANKTADTANASALYNAAELYVVEMDNASTPVTAGPASTDQITAIRLKVSSSIKGSCSITFVASAPGVGVGTVKYSRDILIGDSLVIAQTGVVTYPS